MDYLTYIFKDENISKVNFSNVDNALDLFKLEDGEIKLQRPKNNQINYKLEMNKSKRVKKKYWSSEQKIAL